MGKRDKPWWHATSSTIEVDKDWRGKGIGRDIIEAFMKKGQKWTPDVQFVFAKPGQLNNDGTRYRQKDMSEQQFRADVARDRSFGIAFSRALGLRRVASSDWFVTTFDEMHKEHQLAVEDDHDPQEDGTSRTGEDTQKGENGW